jgi:hypothetical protein
MPGCFFNKITILKYAVYLLIMVVQNGHFTGRGWPAGAGVKPRSRPA